MFYKAYNFENNCGRNYKIQANIDGWWLNMEKMRFFSLPAGLNTQVKLR